MEIKHDGKAQQQFRISNCPIEAKDLARGLRNLADSLERSGRMAEGAVLTITLKP